MEIDYLKMILKAPVYDVARETPLALALVHMFDHQSFHRGEASAMLTALGGEAPALDMLDFFDEDGA